MPGSTASLLDIIVPVHGAAAELGRCLASLVAQGGVGPDPPDGRLHLVIDGPQEADVEAAVAVAADLPAVRVTRLPTRQGFPGAVNAGLARAAGDVVLLNSDTRVTPRWLEKLRAAAHSAPRIASATPWTNSSTITSWPRWLETNELPSGWDEVRLAAAVERVSRRRYPRLPTGVGVCLYLRREAIDAVGPLDEAAFGLGYGEETDWCRRALAAGFEHVLDDATFLYHQGQSSFGAGRAARVRRSDRTLRRRHPQFERDLARFLAEDPLAPLRQAILDEIQAAAPPRPAAPSPRGAPAPSVVHLVHGWPPEKVGGTELYASWLVREQARSGRRIAVYTRRAAALRSEGDALERLEGTVRVRQMVNNFTQRDPLVRNAIWNRGLGDDFGHFLGQEKPDLVHVHHLAGHAANLVSVARRRGFPVVYQVQDWWTGCARANLLDAWGGACPGPGLRRCGRCAPMTRLAPRALWNPALHLLRRRALARALRSANVLLAGSRSLAQSFERLGWLGADQSVEVIPYAQGDTGLEALRAEPVALAGPLRCGFLGTLMPHKGALVAVEAMSLLGPGEATLEIWGNPTDDPTYAARLRVAAPPQVSFHGDFAAEEKRRVFARFDVLVVPSLGAESFGLAAHEALAAGRVVVASRRGALAELEPLSLSGTFFDPEKPAELAAILRSLAGRRGEFAPWRRSLAPSRSFAEHAEAIDRLYARLLHGPARPERRG